MYQPFARKYRPQTFAAVLGQEHVTTTLQNAVRAGRLHHAYLFAGARGVGKTTVARLLAKALNCVDRGASVEPCNSCTSCEEIATGRSLDLQEIDGASHTGVDDVRALRERVNYLPAAGRHKIYIIDEVHMLSNAAFNALLKTLEEPPAHVIFVFATTEPEKIPLTILSRCQRYDFRRVPVARIVEALTSIAQTEEIAVGPDVLHAIAFEAEGSLRDAESLLDQATAFAGTTLTMGALAALLGFTDRQWLFSLVEQIIAKNGRAALATLATASQTGLNPPRLARDLLEIFRHLWILASCNDLPGCQDIPASETDRLRELASRAACPEFQQWFALAYRWADDIGRAKWPQLALEAMVLQMIQVGPAQSVEELLARVDELMGRPAPAAGEPVQETSPAPASPASWTTFLDTLRAAKPQFVSILEHGELLKADASGVELRYAKHSIYGEMLKEPGRSAQLTDLLQAHFGPSCRLVVTASETSSAEPAPEQAREAARQRQAAAHRAAVEHALVREASELFGAEITEIKTHEPT
ncbi:MAG: DNA polymerase III subunit gamma/tau [Deltaproteobacteria bacterium]|nr:DNA polymerase III subunit gamma/tau [Deltaproteobacteria bacterium]